MDFQEKFISYEEYKTIDIKQMAIEKKSMKLLDDLTKAFEGVKEDLN